MADPSRRLLVACATVACAGPLLFPACSGQSDAHAYESVAEQVRRPGALAGADGPALSQELVRNATLAPSSHNTQCWKFLLESHAITIFADRSRRCPAVDPDEHHIFVSLGCAAENLVHAALAHGLQALVAFDASREAIRVALTPTKAQVSPLFNAILARQCTRNDYDSKPLSSEELGLLERAGTSERVQLLLITERAGMERVLDSVVQANTAQMADAAFVKELESWIRFNRLEAVRTRDGLFSGTTGNPTVPTWVGELAFGWFYTPDTENEKYVHQIRSSAGIAVFVGRDANQANWVEVGRCYERFALQATALGIRNALVNQPIEVQAVRPEFAATLGLAGQRPDLVVRFGRGPTMPYSLRRPVQSVLA